MGEGLIMVVGGVQMGHPGPVQSAGPKQRELSDIFHLLKNSKKP